MSKVEINKTLLIPSYELFTCEEERVASSGGSLHDAITAETIDQGRTFPVFGVSESELAFLVPTPSVHRSGLGDGKHVHGTRPGRNELDLMSKLQFIRKTPFFATIECPTQLVLHRARKQSSCLTSSKNGVLKKTITDNSLD